MQILAFIAMICWLYTTYKLLETNDISQLVWI